MTEEQRKSIVKPTAQTPYHIDFSWWQETDRDWEIYLKNLLCIEHRDMFEEAADNGIIDWVDPETAEVKQVDGLQHVLLSHCALREDFLGEHTTVVEAIFRIFMMNGNSPMNVNEIGEKLNRPAKTILRMLSGQRVYRGIRPILN